MTITDTRIPVTLLTGFLGAGKTTLLNQLIRDPKAGRVAVIINEFGDVGLDHDLIEEATEETILMPSGCLCCSIRSDLLRTLGKLLARRNTGKLSFDRVVIETTGIADPGPIMHSLVVDGVVGPAFRMDGVVTVADAATGSKTLETQLEAANQIAMADLIVLSKTDLVSPTDLARFQSQISKLNCTAPWVKSDYGKVLLDRLFGLSAMHDDVSAQTVSAWLGAAALAPDPLAGLSGFGPSSLGTSGSETPAPLAAPRPFDTELRTTPHTHNIASASIEMHTPIPADVFDFWLDTLIMLKGPDVLRVKGIVYLEGVEYPFVFHGVQHIFDTPVPLHDWKESNTTTRIVVIARNMTEEELKASLQTLHLQPSEIGSHGAGMMEDSAGLR